MKIQYALKRLIEKTTYGVVSARCSFTISRYFNPILKDTDKAKLPEGSAILAFNHTFGLDGILISLGIPRQIHYLIQSEDVCDKNIANKLTSWAIGFIPVSVGKLDENGKLENNSVNRGMNIQACRRAEAYLETHKDYVGIFIDGPASRLVDIIGKPIPKSKREASEIAASLSILSGRPIVPVGTHMPEDVANKLWEFGEKYQKSNQEYIETRKKTFTKEKEALIPYQINVGNPILPTDIEGKNGEKRKRLTEMVRKEIIRLSEENPKKIE